MGSAIDPSATVRCISTKASGSRVAARASTSAFLDLPAYPAWTGLDSSGPTAAATAASRNGTTAASPDRALLHGFE
ncbi:hypothetical protein [Nocardioides sp. P5_C9_2]